MIRSSEEHQGVMGASYAEGREASPVLRYRLRLRARVAADALLGHRRVGDGVDVLELGAADGRTLLELHRLLGGHGAFTGVEIADELLATAPPLPANVRLLTGDITELPEELPSRSQDLVCALAVLEHLTNPAACLAEAHRMLRPGGVFVATCPHPTWDAWAARLHLESGEHHATEVTGTRLEEMARAAGFERVVLEPFMHVGTGILPYLHVPISITRSLTLDRALRRVPLMGLGFANQAVVAHRPL